MTDFILVPVVVGILSYTVYRLFELYARRKERTLLIEKLDTVKDSERYLASYLGTNTNSYSSLRLGSLLCGVGLGLLVGFVIIMLAPINYQGGWEERQTMGIVYGASVFLFGGLSLVIAFMVERKLSGRK